MTEKQTIAALILPKLDAAGWSKAQIRQEYTISQGRIVASSRRHRQANPLRADFVLEYGGDLPIAVIEAKRTRIDVHAGIEQARRYAEKLDLPVAYATNGKEIYEVVRGGPFTRRLGFPSPEEMWQRFCRDQGVTTELEQTMLTAPFDRSYTDDENRWVSLRYYQAVAIHRTLRAIAQGTDRILLVLATGTGKTMLAYQLVAKLRNSGWTGDRMPRVLYLADRNILVDQPKTQYFDLAFGDVVHRLRSRPQRSREIYFALYQSLDRQAADEPLYRQYEKDYFDLIIVDECHRGSAASTSQWREILEHFSGAVQVGLTATPVDRGDAVTFDYFGAPLFTYSLKDGIDDGYLAPYRVRRANLNIDVTGYRPEPGQLDTDGEPVPSNLYTQTQYERVIAILDRTETAARYLAAYMRKTGLLHKTIVFCENNDHAGRMVAAINNASLDLVEQYPNYVHRVTNDDGDAGLGQLYEFSKAATDEPVILVTSQLLTTGIDIPPVRNIVIFRRIASVPLFKQVIGRGTRLCKDIEKLSFDIIDLTDATRLFHDPEFDGPPLRIVTDIIDTDGNTVETGVEAECRDDAEATVVVAEPEPEYHHEDSGQIPAPPPEDDFADRVMAQGRRIYVEGVDVYVLNERSYVLRPDGALDLVDYREVVRGQVRSLHLSGSELLTQWAHAQTRAVLAETLRDLAVDPEILHDLLGHPEMDHIDLLINAAWNTPMVQRTDRVARVRQEQREFLDSFGPTARRVLDGLLDKFAEHGAFELNTRALRVRPFTEIGNIGQIGVLFGGSVQLRQTIDRLGEHLFDVAS
ncbi:EcoAI/FtnUII family type I restriction enzme subunit R [Nocardia sp. NPDC050193]